MVDGGDIKKLYKQGKVRKGRREILYYNGWCIVGSKVDKCYLFMSSQIYVTHDMVFMWFGQGDLRPWAGGECYLFMSSQIHVTSTVQKRFTYSLEFKTQTND